MLQNFTRFFASLLVAFAAGAGSVAYAQPAEIEVGANETWQHQWTAMEFPAELGAFERRRISEFRERQSNIGANYIEGQTGTVLSIYLYRPGNPSVAIWFDRALVAIGARTPEDGYGIADLEDLKIERFIPSGATSESGLLAVMKVEQGFQSTGVALYRAGDWLVKLRISSNRMNVSQLQRVLRATLASLPPIEGVSEREAYFVAPCTGSVDSPQAIPFNDPKGDGALAMEASLNLMQAQFHEGDMGPTAQYCRDGEPKGNFSVYHEDNDPNRYEIAVGDAGVSVSVFPQRLYGAEPGGASAVDVYAVQMGNDLSTRVFRPFIGLPSVELVSSTINQEGPLSAVSRPLGNENIEVTLYVDSEQN